MMQEKIFEISDRLKLSVSDSREDKFKLIFGKHSSYIYFDEEEFAKVREVVEDGC